MSIKWLDEGKIECYNTPKNCCVDLHCDRHASFYYNIRVGRMDVQLIFCRKHHEEFYNQLFKIEQVKP